MSGSTAWPRALSRQSSAALCVDSQKMCGWFRVHFHSYHALHSHAPLKLYEDPKVHDALMRDVPIRRLGKPSDMAAAAAFLCSDDAAYVTGMLDRAPVEEQCAGFTC